MPKPTFRGSNVVREKKFIKTTNFKMPKWAKHHLVRYKATETTRAYLRLKAELVDTVSKIPEAKKVVKFYKKMPKNDYLPLMEAFVVVFRSFLPEGKPKNKRERLIVHAAWTIILRADPTHRDIEFFNSGGTYEGKYLVSSAAHENRLPTAEGEDWKQLCREFYYKFDWENDPRTSKTKWKTYKKAWKLMYFGGKPFSELSEKFGYKARSTLCEAFRKYYIAMKEMLAAGEFDSEFEFRMTPEEHDRHVIESFYDTKKWKNPTHKQWYCCVGILDWSMEQVANEWMVPVCEVEDFMREMHTEAEAMLKAHKIPIYNINPLTTQEALPETPLMIKQREEKWGTAEEIDNVIRLLHINKAT